MTDIFDNWRKRLAGEKVPTHDGDPEPGFYRLRKKDAATNEVWWTPVAYFPGEGGELVGVIGDRNMNDREVTDLWTYVCGYPIPEDVYFKFDGMVEVPNAGWPAGLLGAPKREPFANAKNGNAPFNISPEREVIGGNNPPAEEEKPPHERYREQMNNAIAAAPKAVPKTADELAVLEGSKNRIAELRLAADRDGKTIYEPIFRQYQAEQKKWSPLIAMCETAEKALKTLSLTYQENERKRIAEETAQEEARKRKIAEEAAEAQRLQDEANARAADRAISKGEPEPEPEVFAVEMPEPEPVKVEPAKVTPTYGRRTTKAKLQKFAVINDMQKVAAFFIANEEVVALLENLATNAIRAGVEVPGATHREGLI